MKERLGILKCPLICALLLLLTFGNVASIEDSSHQSGSINFIDDTMEESMKEKAMSLSSRYFIQNKGQIDSDEIQFYSVGGNIFFTPGGVLYQFSEMELIEEEGLELDRLSAQIKEPPGEYHEWGVVLNYSFIGSNNVMPEGRDQCSWNTNYFKGNDSEKWYTDVPNYMEIVYPELWDGIDLVYRLKEGSIKYDLIVHPGADPTDILIQINGANDLSVNPQGDLVINTEYWDILDSGLVSYYGDGSGGPIPCRFELMNECQYKISVGAFDKSRNVVIDPLIDYSTFIGGSDYDRGYGIAIDTSGNAYITGWTGDGTTDYPTTSGAFDTTHNGNYDVFVTKLNSDGSSLVYSTYIGGSSGDGGSGIAIDTSGNAYITGSTGVETDYPTTSGAFDTTHNGGVDVFVTKLDSVGSSLVYSTFIGGSNDDRGYGIAIDTSGNSYITGLTRYDTTDYPTTSGAFDTTHNGGYDVFVTKLNSAGSLLVYSTFIGGSNYDIGYGIVIDTSGNVYITGYTLDDTADYPTTSGAFDTTHNGGEDVFVTKLNSAGSSLVYSTFIGGSSIDLGEGIAIDTSGNAYITGSTCSKNYPTSPGAFDTTHNGDVDVFVTKLNSTGSSLVYSTYIGGSGDDEGREIAIDTSGNAYIIGSTRDGTTDYPTTSGAYDMTYNGGLYDVFVTRMNPTGSLLVYSTFIGGSNSDWGIGIAIDTSGTAYITGYSEDGTTDYPTTPGAFDTTPNGNFDVFVSKIDFTVLPSHPINSNGTIGNGFINLTWQPPINVGGADITNYNIYKGLASDDMSLYQTLGNVTTYNDTSIENGGTYYYYFTAVNYVGESPPTDIITVSDTEGPIFTADNCDDSGSTGNKFHISIGAEDNVLVTGVNVEYHFGNQTPISRPMALYDFSPPGFPYTHYITISIPLTSLDPLTYRFNATDPSGNWNVTENVTVTIYDYTPPNLKDEDSDETAYTGETFHIMADINDNIQVDSVWVRTFVSGVGIPGEWNNNSMSFNGDRWFYDLSLSDHSQYLEYQYIFKDIFDNWGSFPVFSRDVVDNDLPQIIENITDEKGYTGGDFYFGIKLEDNIGIGGAEAIYNYRDSGNQTLELQYETGNIWSGTFHIPDTPPIGQFYYKIRYWDLSGNERNTSLRSVGIIDSILPTYIDLTTDTPTTGDPFNIRFEINDNFLIGDVIGYFEIPAIEYDSGFGKNGVFESHFELDQNLMIPDNAVGELRYWLVIEDAYSDGVEIQTPVVTKNIIDNDPPLLEEVFSTGQTFDTGQEVILIFDTKDNIKVDSVKVEYWFNDEITTIQPEYMSTNTHNKKDRYRYFITLPEDSITPLNCRVYSMDSSGLTSIWKSGDIAINDTILPSIEPIDDIKIKVDEILDVTPVVSDNIKVDRIVWEGSPITPIAGKILGQVTEPGEFLVTATVYDETGNSNSTSFTITIENKDEGNLALTIFIIFCIILLISVIVAVIVFVVIRFTRKTKDEETPPPDEDESTISEEQIEDEIPPPPMEENTIPESPYTEPVEDPLTALQEDVFGGYDLLPEQAEPPIEPLSEVVTVPTPDVPLEDVIAPVPD